MKLPHPTSATITRGIIILLVVLMFCAISSFRYAVLFNLLPVCAVGFIVLLLFRSIVHQSIKNVLVLITFSALCFHAYNCLRFGVNFAFDSPEYWHLAQGIASGHGLSGSLYRPPLYPALVAVFIWLGDKTGLFLVIFQHMILIACIPAMYAVGRMFRFSPQASCIAAALLALNSLLMEAAGFIMTETLFMALALIGVASLKKLFDKPSAIKAIGVGALFALATYCRQLLFPLLVLGLVFLFIKKRKQGMTFGLIAIFVYFGATAPWCMRNFLRSGHYAMSASFGLVSFTKASTFGCLNKRGKYYKQIENPFLNTLNDLSLTRLSTPEVPEDDWRVNRIPHALMDSLTTYHGLSYADASSLLGKASMEGFLRNPLKYSASVGASFLALLFEHHDMYPDVKYLVPLESAGIYKFFARMLRGITYVSGHVFLLFPFALLFRGNRRRALLMPFLALCLMYFVTAALQIGLTRYTIPWEPLKALCAAYVVETAFLLGTFIDLKKREENLHELFN